jgi:two-component system nitrogen regulation response regulator NtrX
VKSARSGEEGLRMLEEFRPAIVFLDIWMPGSMDGLDVLKEARPKVNFCEFVMMSGHGTIETAVKAVKLGAWDFVEKPLSIDRILILAKNILQVQSERGEKNALLNKLRKNIAIIGEAPSMMNLKQLIARVSASNSWVLITGENGTGKELVAQNIHYLSSRASRPFVDVNCAAIPEDLIESELFGHEKGAFTGAERARKGKFDHANGGTLFLDEIGDMSLKTQAKILRILQEKRFNRVGSEEAIEVDVRVVAATNKNLELEIKEGRFREDLYYRLNVIPCHVPSLRDRAADIPALVQHFSEQFARDGGFRIKQFSEAAMAKLLAHIWPGNVRELEATVKRAFALADGRISEDVIRAAGLNDDPLARLESLKASGNVIQYADLLRLMEETERWLLIRAMELSGNVKGAAAALLGMNHNTMNYRRTILGIEKPITLKKGGMK